MLAVMVCIYTFVLYTLYIQCTLSAVIHASLMPGQFNIGLYRYTLAFEPVRLEPFLTLRLLDLKVYFW